MGHRIHRLLQDSAEVVIGDHYSILLHSPGRVTKLPAFQMRSLSTMLYTIQKKKSNTL